MRISIIVCTYGRAASLRDLLESLDAQTYSDAEILIVDGNAEPSPAREITDAFLRSGRGNIECNLVPAKRGLTRQRNLGLSRATGEILCFLDDDVTLPEDFLQRVADIFGQREFQDVGGITGYDDLNYSTPLTWRWRLRRALGVIPDLPPGGVDRLGRGIPLSFLQPFTGFKEVGLLPGFCMIYRRSVVGNLRFDELIPTYAGEDRDFSMQVGWRSRLLICGDLHLSHHASPQGRDSELARNFQSAFGMGRRFAKFAHGGGDRAKLVVTFLGDSVIDAIFLLASPGRMNGATFITRIRGFFAGLSSETKARRQPELSSNPGPSKP